MEMDLMQLLQLQSCNNYTTTIGSCGEMDNNQFISKKYEFIQFNS